MEFVTEDTLFRRPHLIINLVGLRENVAQLEVIVGYFLSVFIDGTNLVCYLVVEETSLFNGLYNTQ